MPLDPSPAWSLASRQNGARSAGPTSEAGKARAVRNGVRHGLTSRTFFLLTDEDPGELQRHEATWLAAWRPRDLHEHETASAAIRAMWRESRADRLEAQVLGDLFAAGGIADPAEAQAAKDRAFQALGGPLRYRARLKRERRLALEALRRRRLDVPAPRPDAPAAAPEPPAAKVAAAPPRSEPEHLNRHQRRALEAMARRAA